MVAPVDRRHFRDRNLDDVWSVNDELGLGPEGRLIGTIVVLGESDGARYTNPVWPLSSLVPNDGPPPPQFAESTKDSLGLFQQRPRWWGTGTLDDRVRQLMDARQSALLFYRELADVPGWRGMYPWQAGQLVQRSEYTDGSNYRARMAQASRVLAGRGTYFTGGGR